MEKVVVLVTNRGFGREKQAVLLKSRAKPGFSGYCIFRNVGEVGNSLTVIADPDTEKVYADWGHIEQMTKEEASLFGGSFGAWFSS